MIQELEEDDSYPLEDDLLLEEMVRALVKRPEAVQVVDRSDDPKVKMLHVSVDPEDRGKVIGKGGRMAEVIRHFMSAVGTRNGIRINVLVEAGDDPRRGRHSPRTHHARPTQQSL
jgi:predicted RNA-binding protein YlqC (UPF0109 family)